jgi:lipopolysaccharide transport system ATP-binding protein
MSDIAIKVEGLGKRYRIGAQQQAYRTLREKLNETALAPFRAAKHLLTRNGNGAEQGAEGKEQSAKNGSSQSSGPSPLALSPLRSRASRSETFWALKDVSFEIKRGEVVGIIGRNGAGKSTLLKILSRITEPTEGYADMNGRIASLLEVGTGFHPELTGRENIFLNGSILGMKRLEIKKKFDEIVAFAEIDKFIDTPVKHYSSGMYMRLAFAVAAHLDPEIMLVDEVLAVGDAAFQKKCLGKMSDVAKEGRTVLFVSHNMGSIRKLCRKAILLDGGRVQLNEVTEKVIAEYLTADASHTGHWVKSNEVRRLGGIAISEIRVTNSQGTTAGTVDSNRPFNLIVSVDVQDDMSGAQIHARITNQEGVVVFTTANTDASGIDLFTNKGKRTFKIEIPKNFLRPGMYELTVGTMIPKTELFDIVENELFFIVEDVGSHATILRDGRLGVVTPILEWKEIDGARDTLA